MTITNVVMPVIHKIEDVFTSDSCVSSYVNSNYTAKVKHEELILFK